DARVRPARLGVPEAGEEVAGGRREALGPPDGGAVEDEVVLRTGVAGGGVDARFPAALRRTGGHDLEAGDRRRQAVELPAAQAGHAVAVFHAGAGEDPVLLVGADPG